ncbi:hypothetical protein KEM56_004196 [Ascosphaera pollenicola]|nr:hypothetical protein KEM56_004196 [Ascosphaera pollenicola]
MNWSNDELRGFIMDTVPEIANDDVRLDAYEDLLRHSTREFKYETFKRMKKFVHLAILRSEGERHTSIGLVDRPQGLFDYFCNTVRDIDFYDVFYWTKDILDYEGTGELGRWYMKEIFCNIAVNVKIYLDKVGAQGDDPVLVDGISKWTSWKEPRGECAQVAATVLVVREFGDILRV